MLAHDGAGPLVAAIPASAVAAIANPALSLKSEIVRRIAESIFSNSLPPGKGLAAGNAFHHTPNCF
jgi:hypothetical protein